MSIALYHFHVTQIKRSAGQSAIASAAYRSGEKLYSEYYGEDSDYTQKGGEAYLKSLADAVPMRKTAAPEDCVGTALFLASPASDFMTGNILYPDGGLTCIG